MTAQPFSSTVVPSGVSAQVSSVSATPSPSASTTVVEPSSVLSSVVLVGVSATGSSLSPQLVNNTSEQRILKNRKCLNCFIVLV